MLQVSLLGEQAIVDDADGSISTRSSRAVALVGLLASHADTPQPRQQIAGRMWPDSTDTQALTNLRRELHHLRQALGEQSPLEVSATHLCWHHTSACRVDLQVFERERRAALAAAAASDDQGVLVHGRAAIEEYRGDFLPGVYDEWTVRVREDLERACVGLCDLVVAAGRRVGALAWAIEAARRRVVMQPLEEVGYRTLMELLTLVGDRAGAIRTFHECSSVLERELGVDPDRTTRRLLDELIGPRHPGTAPRARVAEDLVGREGELALLRELWGRVGRAGPAAVLVTGEPGVGKTRLVEEMASVAAQDGAVVASARCFATTGRVPLAPVTDWLRETDIRAAGRTLDPVWLTELDRLVPREGRPADARGPARAMVDAWQKHRFMEGLTRALMTTGRATLLVLEDAQWCDEETLDLLSVLLGKQWEQPLLVAMSARTGEETGRRPADRLRRLRSSGVLTEVKLAPLDRSQTWELATLTSGMPFPEAEADTLHAATGGYPLYVVEATRSGYAGVGPQSRLGAVLDHRLQQVSPEAREIAGLAAAFGRDFSLELLSEASELDTGAVVRAIDELWRHRLVREFKDGYDFSHDLIRNAAYAQVSPPRRWLLHRRLAQGLELVHGAQVDGIAAQLAEQHELAGNPQRALGYLERAAAAATSLFAHSDALEHQRKILTLLERLPQGRDRLSKELDVLTAMAPPLTATTGYASPELQQTLERTIDVCEQLGRSTQTVTTLVGLWASRFVQGRTREAHDIAVELLDLTRAAEPPDPQAHFVYAGSALHLGMPGEAAEHFAVACSGGLAEPLLVGTRLEVHARAWSAHAAWINGEPEQAAEEAAARAVADARAADHPYSLAVALAYAGVTHQMLENDRALDRAVTELLELCSRYRFVYYPAWGHVLQGWLRGGRDGTRLAQRGIDSLRSTGSFARMSYWLMLLAETEAENHDPAAAAATLDAATAAASARDDYWMLPEILRRRAGLDTDPATRTARLVAASDLARKHGSRQLLARVDGDLARLGVHDRARPLTARAPRRTLRERRDS